jgi:hypothetical protein
MSLSSPSLAGIVTVPTGLAPGSLYRLVFVTADGYTATSSQISDYNAFVTTEANAVAALAGLKTTWSVIGSTQSVDAIDNIGSDPGVPIYTLLGSEVASDATANSGGLFGTSLQSLQNPIDIDQAGNYQGATVWTGTRDDGVHGASGYLGSAMVGDGWSSYTDPHWIAAGGASNTSADRPLYAISGVLAAPDAAPEPTTTLMLTLGGALMIGARRRMIHREKRPPRALG